MRVQEVISAADLDDYDPNELLIVTTGSQARRTKYGAGFL